MIPMSLSAENNPKSSAIRGPQSSLNRVERENDNEVLCELSSSKERSEEALEAQYPGRDGKEVVMFPLRTTCFSGC